MDEKGNSLDRKSKTKRRPLEAKSGKSRDFSSAILNSKHPLQQASPSKVYSAKGEFISNDSEVKTFQHNSDDSSEESEAFSWVKISQCTEPHKGVGSKTIDKETNKADSCHRSKLSSKNPSVGKQTKCDNNGNTELCTEVNRIEKNVFEYEHKIGEEFSISNYENKSFNERSHDVFIRNSTTQMRPISHVQTAWRLDQSLTVSDNCSINTKWKSDDAQCENKNLKVKSQTLPRSNSEGFLPLIAAPQHIDSELNSKSFSFPSKQDSKIEFLGKTCKVKLPSYFPGIVNQTLSTAELKDLEETASIKNEVATNPTIKMLEYRELSIRKREKKNQPIKKLEQSQKLHLLVPGMCDWPSSPVTEKMSSSNEYTAARIVGELDKAFNEALGDKTDERRSCFTPNTIRTRYSNTPPRTYRSISPLGDKEALVSSFPHSQSMPNLRDDQITPMTKRTFVTFEKHRPHAKAVDLNSETEIAERCRNLALSMDSLGITNLKDKTIKKKTFRKRWIESYEHCVTPSTSVSGNHCYACRTHKTTR